MIYVTIAVEDGENLLGLPGELVAASTENPYEDLRWDRRELGADERYVAVADIPKRCAILESGWIDDPDTTDSPRFRAVFDPTDWIPHTGTECPVHPLDVVEVFFRRGSKQGCDPTPAETWEWGDDQDQTTITHYRHVTDPDGIPYVYDDGSLPEGVEYIATNRWGECRAYYAKPERHGSSWWNMHYDRSAIKVPPQYTNALVPWYRSRRRVWRD